jgi:2-oxoisovalerate dehydrogenase E1 component
MLLSFASSAEDPISGGRHKVLGSQALMIPPQTSTIASHLPKAVGAAYSIGAARRHRPEHAILPDDAIVYCSFGDASANHSTAQGAFNTAQWTSYQSVPLPLLFVCEDNGIGISTKTPEGLDRGDLQRPARPEIFQGRRAGPLRHLPRRPGGGRLRAHPPQARLPASAHDPALRPCRGRHADHLSPAKRSRPKRRNDPLLHSVRLLDQAGVMSPDQALAIYHETWTAWPASRPKLSPGPA